jgi:hypothetical protein
MNKFSTLLIYLNIYKILFHITAFKALQLLQYYQLLQNTSTYIPPDI